jgi:hypothetical protein
MDCVLHTGVQSKNNACHNVNKVQNLFIDTLILNLIDTVVCVVFALYSSIENFEIFVEVAGRSKINPKLLGFLMDFLKID